MKKGSDDSDILDGTDAAFLRHALGQAVEQGASDVHIVTGHPPTLRLHGRLQELPVKPLTDECVKGGLIEICPEGSRDQFRQDHNADFALELNIGGQPRRFRANYFMSGRTPAPAFGSFRRKSPILIGPAFRPTWPCSWPTFAMGWC